MKFMDKPKHTKMTKLHEVSDRIERCLWNMKKMFGIDLFKTSLPDKALSRGHAGDR